MQSLQMTARQSVQKKRISSSSCTLQQRPAFFSFVLVVVVVVTERRPVLWKLWRVSEELDLNNGDTVTLGDEISLQLSAKNCLRPE